MPQTPIHDTSGKCETVQGYEFVQLKSLSRAFFKCRWALLSFICFILF